MRLHVPQYQLLEVLSVDRCECYGLVVIDFLGTGMLLVVLRQIRTTPVFRDVLINVHQDICQLVSTSPELLAMA